MGKFHDFFITKILREINFVDSRSAKTADFSILGGMNFVHLGNFSLQKSVKFLKKSRLLAFALLESLKLISRKILVIEKLRNFHTFHI